MPVRRLLAAALVTTCVAGMTLTPGLAATAPPEVNKAFDAATRAAIQSVITHQLDAFSHDDGKAAEAFASQDLQTKFPDPDRFLAMVKENYGALIKPRSTSFGETSDSPHGPLQKVTVVAADGTVWEAIYSFDKVGDEWRITGCGIEKDDNQQAI